MAETQRVASSPASSRPSPKPRPRHPLASYNPPLRRLQDETQDLRPPGIAAVEIPSLAVSEQPAPKPRRESPPPRSPAEWLVLAVLLFGLGLNLVALLTDSRLTHSDLLLGGSVLLAGIVLLGLMELCRRSGAPPAAD
jgi:hypothetical protein